MTEDASQGRPKNGAAAVRARISGADVLIAMGLLLLCIGLWLWAPALALTVVGALLVAIGLASAWVRGR